MRGDRLIKRGTVCRVIEDGGNFFKPGDIVVVLDKDSEVPNCCLLKDYNPEYPIYAYSEDQYNPLIAEDELEELYDWSEK